MVSHLLKIIFLLFLSLCTLLFFSHSQRKNLHKFIFYSLCSYWVALLVHSVLLFFTSGIFIEILKENGRDLLILFPVLVALAFQYKIANLPMFLAKIYVSLLCLVFMLGAAEYGFENYFIQSDGFSFTLMSKKWFSKYWTPINTLGYRDKEHVIDPTHAKTIVLVVGDSFAAGQGINDIDDRFSGVLQKQLGNQWDVITVAKCGWDPNQEFNALSSSPYQPDIIILSYYINDIETACTENGFPYEIPTKKPSGPWLEPLVEKSFLANYFYWRMFRFVTISELGRGYANHLYRCYDNEIVFKAHEKELKKFIDFSRRGQATLIGVIFPSLVDLAGSKSATDKIIQYLQSEQIQTLDVSTLVHTMKTNALIVNSCDVHPSRAVHAVVGKRLAELINENKPQR